MSHVPTPRPPCLVLRPSLHAPSPTLTMKKRADANASASYTSYVVRAGVLGDRSYTYLNRQYSAPACGTAAVACVREGRGLGHRPGPGGRAGGRQGSRVYGYRGGVGAQGAGTLRSRVTPRSTPHNATWNRRMQARTARELGSHDAEHTHAVQCSVEGCHPSFCATGFGGLPCHCRQGSPAHPATHTHLQAAHRDFPKHPEGPHAPLVALLGAASALVDLLCRAGGVG